MPIAARLAFLLKSIDEYADIYQRKPGSVRLLAVSKGHTVDSINKAMLAGQLDFGENYLQEAMSKMAELSDAALVWHFVGRIQSNKARLIAEHFEWVHSLCDLKNAKKLSDARPAAMGKLNVCLQVNIDEDSNKGGVSVSDLSELLAKVSLLPRLRVRGLMTILKFNNDFERQKSAYTQLANVSEQLRIQYPNMDTLSMGMSGDYEAAIAAGATMIRVGQNIFGPRKKQGRELK